jgi:hypothetical protein
MEHNLDFLDKCRRAEPLAERASELGQMYERVKIDRNRYMNSIQTSRQLIVEYAEKIHILENEVDVLRFEFNQVEGAVRIQKGELVKTFGRRDQTRSDLKQAEFAYIGLPTQIDFQDSAIASNQMVYDIEATDCSNKHKLLIDKRDELTLVSEQFARHEWVMLCGEVRLRFPTSDRNCTT